MIASVFAGKQALTDPTWLACATVRRAVKRLLDVGQPLYGAAMLVALACLSGCTSPHVADQRSSQIGAQRSHVPSHITRQPQHAPPHHTAQGRLSPATEHLARSIRQSGDHQGLPFLIIDKVAANIAAFDARGRVLGVSPALLGWARGDHSVPGIGDRPIARIRPHERTTPAGRFVIEMGRNMQGEEIVWLDYEAAVSLHRVRATNPEERRLERLASPTPLDNRISYGCINIPARYFDHVVKPLMSGGKAIAYVLPEVMNTQEVFAFVRTSPATYTEREDQNGNRAERPGLIPVKRTN